MRSIVLSILLSALVMGCMQSGRIPSEGEVVECVGDLIPNDCSIEGIYDFFDVPFIVFALTRKTSSSDSETAEILKDVTDRAQRAGWVRSIDTKSIEEEYANENQSLVLLSGEQCLYVGWIQCANADQQHWKDNGNFLRITREEVRAHQKARNSKK